MISKTRQLCRETEKMGRNQRPGAAATENWRFENTKEKVKTHQKKKKTRKEKTNPHTTINHSPFLQTITCTESRNWAWTRQANVPGCETIVQLRRTRTFSLQADARIQGGIRRPLLWPGRTIWRIYRQRQTGLKDQPTPHTRPLSETVSSSAVPA